MRFKFILIVILFPFLCQGQIVKGFKAFNRKVDIKLSDGILSICPLTDNSVRVRFYKDIVPKLPEFIINSALHVPEFKVSDSPLKLEIKLKDLTVEVEKQTGSLSYLNNSGKIFLKEISGTRKLLSDSVMGEPCFVAGQSFESPHGEYIFGLGQFQDGHYNLKGVTRRLTQVNSQIALPFIYSNKGYGLLWHQYGLTDFNPNNHFVTLEKQEKSASDNNQMIEVTTTSGTQKIAQTQSLYTGKYTVPDDGEYSIFLDLGDLDNRHYVAIDGKPCIDFSNFWLPPTASVLIKLGAGEHTLQLVCKSGNHPEVSWRLNENVTTFCSPNAKLLDYVVFYGPSADSVISTYRMLSGNAPMFPQWAYGFWQCRERYSSGNQLVETVEEFRKRQLPMDVIVQDWQYWGNRGWGVPIFDTINYAHPDVFIKKIHDLNAHFNISIWSNPDKNSQLGKEYVAKNLFIPNTKWLDYFNPETRKEYWNTLKTNMFDYGVDSWWMDAVEPENDALKGVITYAGPGDFYRLTYPLMVSQTVYEGQREASSDKRVCILTRSAFLGQQRYGIINWSGDIGGNWETFKRQIVAGLDYSITGMPYWTTDIGGFFRPGQSQYTDENYHELLIRWYQWGAFNPIFRIHGFMSETEPWKYGQIVEDIMRKMLNLRYCLLPYIYSNAWDVTKNGSTIMRPLVMDFREDTLAISQSFEYMFGKSILVAPITEAGVDEWSVYLPKTNGWYDFWTGKKYNGGKKISIVAPLDRIPLFVRAGAILPIGPKEQYAFEEKWDKLEIRIYEGSDGEFTLYQDEGDNYNYETGAFSTITFTWNDIKKTLTINDRQGSFKGMLPEQKFNIVLVTRDKGTGLTITEKSDKVVNYSGKKAVVKLK